MSGSIQLSFERELHLGIDLSGDRLVPGSRGAIGLPVEAFLRLYAVSPSGNAREIRSLADILTSITRIADEEQVRKLLQLETAPETHFLFPASHRLDVRVSPVLERPGDVLERAARAAGYAAPVLRATASGFEAVRDLLVIAPGAPALVRRTEHLSRAAQYLLVDERPLAKLASADVVLPEYE